MKKLVLSIVAVAVMGTVLVSSNTATAQNRAAAKSTLPHKIGLIDMAYVFKNYDKFTEQRDQLQESMKALQERTKLSAQKLESIQAQLKETKPTSPEFSSLEKKFATTQASIKADVSKARRDLVIKEAELYKATYLEVTQMVKHYAKFEKYTLILRYNQETVAADDGPQQVLQKMNRQVVYSQPGDDITNKVLGYMNSQYKKSAGKRSTTTRQ